MEPITLSEAAKAMNARVMGSADGTVTSICTDTRQGAGGSLFFALHGENSDGHRFVVQALEAGTVAAVVDHPVEGPSGTQLVVPDTLRALGDLGRFYRDRFNIPVVAVTGSVGKTSTREMVACALRAKLNVHSSEKNYNNEIGVPQTLFGLDRSHEAVVIEMGMRLRGEIARLAEIARPTVGLITNIGLSHIERLGSRDEIAAAKGELLEALPEDGTAVINADNEYADYLRSLCQCRIVTFGVDNSADFRATDVSFSDAGESRFRINGQEISLRTPGVHHIGNAAAASAVADSLGIGLDEVAAALAEFRSPAMRMETLQTTNGVTVLNDAYNAAPDSMHAALQTLAQLAGRSRRAVAILGEMRELGDYSAEAHRYVGETAASQGVDLLVTVGPAAQEMIEAARASRPNLATENFEDTDLAAMVVPGLIEPGDVVLVKGSRAMEMEKIVAALTSAG